ncbi:MAG: tetratricopeptide repeat protein [Candidatus Auribacterota bacterium]|jgi:tetratricopeptide (TPR) repeat protein|nr:tetratricopeptide repeat protein [Candidatus Auribacterota bacterium]
MCLVKKSLLLIYIIGLAMSLVSCAPMAGHQAKVVQYDTEKGFWKPSDMPDTWGKHSIEEKYLLDTRIREHYDSIDRVVPTSELYFDLAILLYQRCRMEEASSAFDKAIELDPYNPELYYLNACVNFFSKRYDLARKHLTRSKQLGFRVDPDTDKMFRTTSPAIVDYYRAAIRLDLEKPYNKQGLYVTSIDEIMALPESEIDIATFALLISKQASEKLFDKSFDIEFYRSKIDRMVVDILQMIGAETRPAWVSNVINNYIFRRQNYSAPIADTADVMRPSYHLLNFVIDNKKGVCMSLSLLYLSIAERLKLPFYGVIAPGHFFVRYDDLVNSINIETTAFGRQYSNEHYRSEYPNLDTSETLYYKNLTKRETMACFLNNIATVYQQEKLYNDAIDMLKLSIRMNPRFTEPYVNLGNTFSLCGQFDLAIDAYKEGLNYNERSSALLRNLGLAYLYTSQTDNALEELKLSLAINPDDPQARHFLGLAYNQKGMHQEAVYELKRALAYYPDSVEILFELAKSYYFMGEYSTAWMQVKKIRQQGKRIDPEFLDLLKQKQEEPAN